MCLIIHRNQGAKALNGTWLSNSSINNPDGWGFVARRGKSEIYTGKSMDMSGATAAIRELEKADAEFLFHYRFSTHGTINLENAHPFEVAPDSFLVHNGVMNKVKIVDKRFSDTFHFAKEMQEYLSGVKSRTNKVISKFLKARDEIIGVSKIAVMAKGIDTIIYNKELGYELDGSWFSNEYSLESPAYKSYNKAANYSKGWKSTDPYEYDDDFFDADYSAGKGFDRRTQELFDDINWGYDDLEYRIAEGEEVSAQELCEIDAPALAILMEHYPSEITKIMKTIKWID